MYQNQVHRPATDAEKAILTAYAQQHGVGKPPAQMAAELNDPARTAPNPAPADPVKSVLKAIITKSAVQNLLTMIILEIMGDASKSSLLAKYQYVQAQVNAHDGDYALFDVSPYAQQMIADGLLPAAEVAALTTTPDPAYQPVIAAGPLAFQLFGEAVAVEAGDFS